jgi:hypothetical protein
MRTDEGLVADDERTAFGPPDNTTNLNLRQCRIGAEDQSTPLRLAEDSVRHRVLALVLNGSRQS